MPFQEGNKYGKGPPKKLKTQVKDFIKEHPNAVAELLLQLYDRGMKGDKDCAIYVIDRIEGRPRQSLDARVSKEIILTADDYELISQLKDSDIKLIGGGNEYREAEGTSEAEEAETA